MSVKQLLENVLVITQQAGTIDFSFYNEVEV